MCRELGIGHSTIRAIWAKYVKTGSTQNLFRSGRSAIISEMETRLLCHTSKKNLFLTARELGNECGILSKASVDTGVFYATQDYTEELRLKSYF